MAARFILFTIVGALFLTVSANAATRIWDGGGSNNNWMTAANWTDDIAPIANDDLVFPATATQQNTNNNFLLFTNFNSITFTGGNYTVSGNPFSLGAGGFTVETGTQAINVLTVRLNVAQTFTATQANAVATFVSLQNLNSLIIDGNGQFGIGFISGSGSLTKKGLGAILLASASGFLGAITVENGILVADGNLSNSPVNVTGGALGGTGTVGATNVTAGGISAGTLTTPTGILTVQGNLTVGSNAAIIIKFAGNTAGSFDQINVNGTVNLIGSRLVPVPLNNFTPAVGDSFTIINNDGSDPVIGTFAGIAENAVFVAPNGLAFRVSYVGGTGNDVTITRVGYAPFDFDGDGKTDISVFRPSNGVWYRLNSSNNQFTAVQFGLSGDLITPADFDGDGKTDIAVYRPSNGVWYILNSSDNAFRAVQFGTAEDIPTPADFDGDGKKDIAVFRPSSGVWYQLRSATNQFYAEQFGQAGDVPAPADYDSDSIANIAVFRPSSGVWYIRLGAIGGGGVRAVQFGQAGDKAIPADFDNDGIADIAVYRDGMPSFFYVLRSSDGAFSSVQWGISGDIPILGDYDGDDKIDVSVFRPSSGEWYLLLSATGGFRVINFGVNGDLPVPAASVR